MRPRLITALSSALFKSYLRASQRGQRVSISFLSQPRVMLVIDIFLFALPVLALQSLFGVSLPADIVATLAPLILQAMISLPLLMSLAIVVAGLMFELGQGSVISSSEAANWLPISPREYVAASALSISSLYSAFLALAAGVTLPLTLKFGLFYLWPVAMILSIISLLLGAFIVEVLRAVMNRVSSTVYRKKGRLGLVIRLLALVILFSIVQLAFQPYVLYWILGQIVGGIQLAWAVPFVWPSIAVISLASHDLVQTALFATLSLVFALFMYEIASQLRRKYWSPIPISITIGDSAGYLPKGSEGLGFGFSPLASALALKEFRALLRRKDLSRFIAIPVVIAISLLVPTFASPGGMNGRAPGFFLAAMMPFIIPLMFSSISIGQEGNSIANLLSLPIRPNDLIRGKLAPTWLVSGSATVGVIAAMEVAAPVGLNDALAVLLVSIMVIVINSFIGLGIGARWPDYTISARSRYVTLKGFIIGFTLAGLATLAVFVPLGLHIITSGGIRGTVPFPSLDLLTTLIVSLVLGGILIVISYTFCKKGVESLLSSL